MLAYVFPRNNPRGARGAPRRYHVLRIICYNGNSAQKTTKKRTFSFDNPPREPSVPSSKTHGRGGVIGAVPSDDDGPSTNPQHHQERENNFHHGRPRAIGAISTTRHKKKKEGATKALRIYRVRLHTRYNPSLRFALVRGSTLDILLILQNLLLRFTPPSSFHPRAQSPTYRGVEGGGGVGGGNQVPGGHRHIKAHPWPTNQRNNHPFYHMSVPPNLEKFLASNICNQSEVNNQNYICLLPCANERTQTIRRRSTERD